MLSVKYTSIIKILTSSRAKRGRKVKTETGFEKFIDLHRRHAESDVAGI